MNESPPGQSPLLAKRKIGKGLDEIWFDSFSHELNCPDRALRVVGEIGVLLEAIETRHSRYRGQAEKAATAPYHRTRSRNATAVEMDVPDATRAAGKRSVNSQKRFARPTPIPISGPFTYTAL